MYLSLSLCVSVSVYAMRNIDVDRYIQNLVNWDSDHDTEPKGLSEQSKELRKRVQNRKAQKAFRLRKEAKLMELEQKLSESERIQSQLHDEVNKLKDENILINKVYRHLNKVGRKPPLPSPSPPLSNDSKLTSQPKYDVVFPTINEFYDTVIDDNSKHGHNHDQVSNLQYNDKEGNILLTVPATWKYLLDLHEKKLQLGNSNNSAGSSSTNNDYEENEMDIDLIMASLRGHEQCHGHGPAYRKSLIDQVIKYHRRR